LPGYKNPRYFDRQEAFPGIQSQIRGSVEDVDRVIAELIAKVEELKAALTELCRVKVAELGQLKAELSRNVEKALTEVESSLAEEHPRLAPYAALFRDVIESPRPVPLFTYQLEISSHAPFQISYAKIKPQDVPKASSIAATSCPRPPDTNKPTKYFASVCYDSLTLLEISTQQVSQHRLTTNFKGGASFVEMDQRLLMCLGSKPASTATFALDIITYIMTPLQHLSIAREAPGVAKCAGSVYAFGGIDGGERSQNTCEKWNLEGGRWWNTSNSMKHPRAYFTPCLFKACLYLMTTFTQSPVEMFRCETETFEELPIAMPKQLRFGWRSVSFVADEQLCVLTEGEQVARWNIERSREFQVQSTKRACWSTQPPQRDGDQVLIAYDGQVVKFNLVTFSFVA
jgi:hypothetical protein